MEGETLSHHDKKRHKHMSLFVLFVMLLFTLLIILGYFASKEEEKWIACTADAKLCPDGSAVGRTGPNCEFAPCPGE